MSFLIGLLMSAVAATTTVPAPTTGKTPAPETERIAVYLQTDAQDAVGADYVERLRQSLDDSSTYRRVTQPASARFVVGIQTMDPNEAVDAGRGEATVAAVTLRQETGEGISEFVYSWVLVARRDKVDALAAALLDALDQEIRQEISQDIRHEVRGPQSKR